MKARERVNGTSEMSRLDFWSLVSSRNKKLLVAESSKIAAGRMILFDEIIKRSPKDDILEAINVYKKLKDVVGENDEDFLLATTFNQLEKELYRIDPKKETLYLPGGYSGLYLTMKQSNKENKFEPQNTNPKVFEELMLIDIKNGADPSHFRVVASFTFNFNILRDKLWQNCKSFFQLFNPG